MPQQIEAVLRAWGATQFKKNTLSRHLGYKRLLISNSKQEYTSYPHGIKESPDLFKKANTKSSSNYFKPDFYNDNTNIQLYCMTSIFKRICCLVCLVDYLE